jgi:hypothetical protein
MLTIGTVVVMFAMSLYLRLSATNLWTLAALLAFDVVALGALALVSYCKTDGDWRWRWGDRRT